MCAVLATAYAAARPSLPAAFDATMPFIRRYAQQRGARVFSLAMLILLMLMSAATPYSVMLMPIARIATICHYLR